MTSRTHPRSQVTAQHRAELNKLEPERVKHGAEIKNLEKKVKDDTRAADRVEKDQRKQTEHMEGIEDDIQKLPSILRSIQPKQVAELRAGLALVRSRFGYASLARNELRLWQGKSPLASPPDHLTQLAASNEKQGGEDALQTVMRVLLIRAASRGAHAAG